MATKLRVIPVVVVALALLVPTAAQAWTARLSVGQQARDWQSPQVFAKDDLLRLRIFVRGHELAADDSSDCASTLYGYGLAVRVNVCGGHLKLRAANATGALTQLRIHYYRL